MGKQMREMKKTIARVSLFRAVKNARAVIMAILVIDFVQRVFFRYPVTGLYILLLNAVVPFVTELAIEDKVRETREKELLVLQERYKYNRKEYYAQGGTVLLTVFTLWAWYQRTSTVRNMSWHLKRGPLFMLVIYVGTIIVLFYRYFRESKERLNNNKL